MIPTLAIERPLDIPSLRREQATSDLRLHELGLRALSHSEIEAARALLGQIATPQVEGTL